ncbi:hypothetical protein K443DRAFT_681695 [Laccaria amethystina LaAM-08-1]|uniref:Uncharacterized protein n=1 Tax=Laccaria amethystina LaAM-08-1 TaxID=1095629 RepID=A0A0C9X776_9AGAR|nr:hypothetical protein K443DRAFT_681695 [Laccaria amethystina LaAM-08-1]
MTYNSTLLATAADHISAYYSHDTDHGTSRSGSPMKTEWKSSHVDRASSNNTLQYQKSEKSDKRDKKTHMHLCN